MGSVNNGSNILLFFSCLRVLVYKLGARFCSPLSPLGGFPSWLVLFSTVEVFLCLLSQPMHWQLSAMYQLPFWLWVPQLLRLLQSLWGFAGLRRLSSKHDRPGLPGLFNSGVKNGIGTKGAFRVGISRVSGFCAALLFAASVSAAETIDLGPSDYRNYGSNASHTPAGVRSSFPQTVRIPSTGANLPVTRNAVIPYGSIKNGLRNFLRVNPQSAAASAAVTGIFIAVDWVWDEAEQSWGKREFQCPQGAICAIDGEVDLTTMCGPYPHALKSIGEVKTVISKYGFSHGSKYYPAGTAVTVTVIPFDGSTYPVGFVNHCTSRYPSGRWPTSPQGHFPILIRTPVAEPDLSEPEEVFFPPTEADWSKLGNELPLLPAPDVGTAAADTQRKIGGPLPGYSDTTASGPSSVAGPEKTTTTTDPVTGDTVVTTTQTITNISYGDTTITTTNTTTTTTYVNGTPTGTTVTTETPGDLPVSSSEWPGFCDWATVVCDWLEWTKEPPLDEPDLPQVVDDDFEQTKNINFGAKSCPPDYQINIAFINTVVAVPMQPLCDFAGIIYYMVMSAAYIFAAYISIGVVRNG